MVTAAKNIRFIKAPRLDVVSAEDIRRLDKKHILELQCTKQPDVQRILSY